MKTDSQLSHLFENNRTWANKVEIESPGFFQELSRIQRPEYLWIGCSDSRVPANEIVALPPGDLFVHRNIANQVIHTDFNCLSVIQYAVDILQVKHIIVCGHYGCGGIKAAFETTCHGLIDNWLRNLQEIIRIKKKSILKQPGKKNHLNALAELNVIRQALNVGDTTIVQDAWNRRQNIVIHGWIYSLTDGLLKDLNINVCSIDALKRLEENFFEEG